MGRVGGKEAGERLTERPPRGRSWARAPGLDEMAHPGGVEHGDAHAGLVEGGPQGPFPAAGGLAEDVRGGVAAEQLDQAAMAGRGVGQVVEATGPGELRVFQGEGRDLRRGCSWCFRSFLPMRAGPVGPLWERFELGTRASAVPAATGWRQGLRQVCANGSAPRPSRPRAERPLRWPLDTAPDKGTKEARPRHTPGKLHSAPELAALIQLRCLADQRSAIRQAGTPRHPKTGRGESLQTTQKSSASRRGDAADHGRVRRLPRAATEWSAHRARGKRRWKVIDRLASVPARLGSADLRRRLQSLRAHRTRTAYRRGLTDESTKRARSGLGAVPPTWVGGHGSAHRACRIRRKGS